MSQGGQIFEFTGFETARFLPFFDLRTNMLFVAIGTIAVTELRRRPLLDIPLDRFPALRCVANALTVRAHRQQSLELLYMSAETQHALGGSEPRPQLVYVDGLRDEIIGARIHAFEIAFLAAGRRDQQEVTVAIGRARAHPPDQLRSVDLRHLPI